MSTCRPKRTRPKQTVITDVIGPNSDIGSKSRSSVNDNVVWNFHKIYDNKIIRCLLNLNVFFIHVRLWQFLNFILCMFIKFVLLCNYSLAILIITNKSPFSSAIICIIKSVTASTRGEREVSCPYWPDTQTLHIFCT